MADNVLIIAKATSNTCTTDFAVNVAVNRVTAGTISSSSSICPSGDPDEFTGSIATAPAGALLTYQWWVHNGVTWNNTGGYHNVNGTQATFPNNPQGFGNGVAAAPWSFQWVFTIAGTYDYQCDPHAPGMSGVIIVNSSTLAADLFISEYAEGSGTNKYIEIFNGTGQDVDLSNYQLWKVTNGGTWPEYTFNLSSILSHNHVYIVYSSSSSVDPLIAAAGDVTWSQVTWTGDDAVGLAKQVAKK